MLRQKTQVGKPSAHFLSPIPNPQSPIPVPPYIHPTAIVDAGAEIGEGTKIWHFSHVMPKAHIGRHCSLGQNVFVANDVEIGDHVKIQNNVSLYEGVVLEDYVFCGPSMVFTNVRTPRSAYPRNTSSDYHPTRIKHGASIAANATVVCGVTVGRWAFIAAGAVATKDVPDYALVMGVPGRIAGWVSEAGLTLRFENSRAVCPQTGQVYFQHPPTCVERIQ